MQTETSYSLSKSYKQF